MQIRGKMIRFRDLRKIIPEYEDVRVMTGGDDVYRGLLSEFPAVPMIGFEPFDANSAEVEEVVMGSGYLSIRLRRE